MSVLADTKNISQLYEVKECSVSEISAKIKSTIEITFDFVKIRGEISGLKIASSGHCYFNLKDDGAVIAVTYWKGAFSNIDIKLEDGIEVVINGKITTYPNMSRYQINVLKIQLSGIGSLMQLLEKRRIKLLEEGLFDDSRKKPIPLLPRKIGIVTSITGAVIQDILHRIRERCPVHVIIWPVLVQGEKAADEIADAIYGFNKHENIRPDLIIVARGGGSIEDLWAFNEEIVVRSVASSDIPVISAIGHETDYTLIDFVSDKRAPTPTAAAEFAVPVIKDIKLDIENSYNKILNIPINYIQYQSKLLQAYSRNYIKFSDILHRKGQILDDIEIHLKLIMPMILQKKRSHLEKYHFSPTLLIKMLEIKQYMLRNTYQILIDKINQYLNYYTNSVERYFAKLSSIDYHKIVNQGFAVIRDKNGKVVLSKNNVVVGDSISIEVQDGKINVIVE